MALEIERRFIVKGEGWKEFIKSSEEIEQGYLNIMDENWAVRIRIINKKKSFLTLKSETKGIARHEFEYQIPLDDANFLYSKSSFTIKKTRFNVNINNVSWVVDCFKGKNSPLILAELELESIYSKCEIPDWCLQEITSKKEWNNASLAKTPIAKWSMEERLKVSQV